MLAGGVCAAAGVVLLVLSFLWDRRPTDRWGDRATNVRVVGCLMVGAALLFVTMALVNQDIWG